MMKDGYLPGKGLGPCLEGISAPIQISENKGRAGIGYPKEEDLEEDLGLVLSELFVSDPTFFESEIVSAIEDHLDNQGEVYITNEPLTNWKIEVAFNDVPTLKEPDLTNQPTEDMNAEAETLREIEKRMEWEKPKFQPFVEELEDINLGGKTENKEVKVGK
ncbi:hypothetical protein CR513_34543, partial [Mucuna pruriens]